MDRMLKTYMIVYVKNLEEKTLLFIHHGYSALNPMIKKNFQIHLMSLM